MRKLLDSKIDTWQKGQSIVELTLITPLLLIALYVPVDFGIAFFMGNMLSTTARDGARIGSGMTKTGGTSTNPTFATADANTLKNAIVGQLPVLLKSRQIVVTFYEGTNCAESVEVTASGTYNIFFYQILRLFGATVNDITITRTTRMRYNYQPFTQNTPCTTMSVDHQTYSIADA